MESTQNIFFPRRILGIDPGTRESAYSVFIPNKMEAPVKRKADNALILKDLRGLAFLCDFMAIEQLKAYGHASDSLFYTAMWTGRFISAWVGRFPSSGQLHFAAASDGGFAIMRFVKRRG
jgi:hypothetical protein